MSSSSTRIQNKIEKTLPCCKRWLLQHPIGYCHVCKIQSKRILTSPLGFEPIFSCTYSKPQTEANQPLPIETKATGHCPTPPATAQRCQSLPTTQRCWPLPIPATAQNCWTSSSTARPLPKIARRLPPLPNHYFVWFIPLPKIFFFAFFLFH
jgi:hypothetical protein